MPDFTELIENFRNANNEQQQLYWRNVIVDEISYVVGPKIFSFFDRDLAEEVLQESLIKINEKLPTFRGLVDGVFESWCCRIAFRTGFKLGAERRKDILHNADPDALWEMAEEIAMAHPKLRAAWLDMKDALNSLRVSGSACFRLLCLYYIVGFDQKELGQILGTNRDKVKRQLKSCSRLAKSLMTERLSVRSTTKRPTKRS